MRSNKLRRTPKVFSASYQPASAKKSANFDALPIIRLVVIGVILFGLTRLPIFTVQNVSVSGVTNEEMKKDLESLVGSSIFSGRIAATTQGWLTKDSTLSDLTCRRGLPSSLSCQAVNRAPSLIWQYADKQFLVDQAGRTYALKQADLPEIPIVEERGGSPIELGQEVASAEVIEQIVRLKSLTKERSIEVGRFFIADSLYQVGAVITAFQDANNQPVQKELSALFVTTQTLDSQVKTLHALLKERGASISERVDLRVPGYVYYK